MAALSLKGRNVAVLGADSSTAPLLKFLLKKGAMVKVLDARAPEVIQANLADQVDLAKIQVEMTLENNPKLFEGIAYVVVPGGQLMDAKVLETARLTGIPVYSELDFVSFFIEVPIIAVAGTNGKTTTASILSRMLEANGKSVFTNALQPTSNYLVQTKDVDMVVAVTNAFQLEGIQNFKPNAILMLNIAEDHTNRYPNFETYLGANREIFKNIDVETLVVLNATDPNVANLAQTLVTPHVFFFNSQPLPPEVRGAWFNKTHLFVRMNVGETPVQYNLQNLRLRGPHNRENLAAAAIVATYYGCKQEAIMHVIENVAALPNRTEFVKRINSVAFYNDACGANVQGVVKTLQAFQEPVILISGGRDKNLDFSPLIPHIRQRVKNLILVGEAKEKVNRAIGDYTETFLVGTVEEAVLLAYQKSRSGDVILFSPGCDPHDAFKSHDEKGDYFKKLVNQIAQPRRPNVI